jgi:hypothetical protein
VSDTVSPPEIDELEVSLFGPGFGESIVLHLGDGKWIIVDSCLRPGYELPAPLTYLIQLGIDVDYEVYGARHHWLPPARLTDRL